jgi:hypothetical protein
MKDVKWWKESTSFGDVIKVARDGTGWGIKNYFSGIKNYFSGIKNYFSGIKNYFSGSMTLGGDHDIKHLFTDDKPVVIKWRFEGDYGFKTGPWVKTGFRTGPSIFAQQDWFRIGGGSSNATEYGGWIKTGSRTSEDFRQEDWFRVNAIKETIIRWGKTGGWDPRHEVPRMAHTCPF